MGPFVDVEIVTERDEGSIEVRSLSIVPGDDREYERVLRAEATLSGPRGAVEIERRYEALPRHNDVVDPTVVESNDGLVERADAVHVYTQWFTDGEYRGDGHEVWEPDDPSVLADDAAFEAACREHVARTATRTYAAGFDR